MKKTLGSLIGIALFAAMCGSISAQIINIQFEGGPRNGTGPVPFTGQGALAAPGNTWNSLVLSDNAEDNSGPGDASGTFSDLVTSTGGSTFNGLTSAGITVPDTFSQDQHGSSSAGTSNNLLLSFLVSTSQFGTAPDPNYVTLTGLTPGEHFNLYLYGTDAQEGDGTQFTVDGSSQDTSGAAGTPYQPGADYVVYDNVVATGGDIKIYYAPNPGQDYGYSAFNGLQLQAVVPEPSSLAFLILGAAGLLGCFYFRRHKSA